MQRRYSLLSNTRRWHLLKIKAGNAWFPAFRYLWWAQQDSNLQPRDYESPAPPLSYRPAREALGYSIPNGQKISNSAHFLREKTRDGTASSTQQHPRAPPAPPAHPVRPSTPSPWSRAPHRAWRSQSRWRGGCPHAARPRYTPCRPAVPRDARGWEPGRCSRFR